MRTLLLGLLVYAGIAVCWPEWTGEAYHAMALSVIDEALRNAVAWARSMPGLISWLIVKSLGHEFRVVQSS